MNKRRSEVKHQHNVSTITYPLNPTIYYIIGVPQCSEYLPLHRTELPNYFVLYKMPLSTLLSVVASVGGVLPNISESSISKGQYLFRSLGWVIPKTKVPRLRDTFRLRNDCTLD